MPNKELQSTSEERYALLGKLGEGGQGYVWRVKRLSDGREMALKWYRERFATPQRRAIIMSVIQAGPPDIPAFLQDHIQFVWPIDFLEDPDIPGFGYVMDLFDSRRFLSIPTLIYDIVAGDRPNPSVDTLAWLSYLVVAAFDAIHAKGYAYCDVSPGNVLFDPENRRIVICDNDNVVVNQEQVDVLGTPEYMAPEVALGKTQPNELSDLHSIAVILYELWTWIHPFQGARTDKVRCWDLPAIQKFYAREPVFHHHPTDSRNTIRGLPDYATHVARWDLMCPSPLKKLFTRAFVEGVQEPGRRPRLWEWKQVFLEMESNTVTCSCGARNVIDLEADPAACFHCKRTLPNRAFLEFRAVGTPRLVILPGKQIRGHHLGWVRNGRELEEVGRLEPHPHGKGVIIRNQMSDPWRYVVPDPNGGKRELEIPQGQARALVPNSHIYIGSVKVRVVRKT